MDKENKKDFLSFCFGLGLGTAAGIVIAALLIAVKMGTIIPITGVVFIVAGLYCLFRRSLLIISS